VPETKIAGTEISALFCLCSPSSHDEFIFVLEATFTSLDTIF